MSEQEQEKEVQQQVEQQVVEEKPKHPGGRPTKYNGTLPERVDLFIQKCISEDKLPTHAGLAVFLKISKATVEVYAKKYPEFQDSLSILNARQEEMLVNRGLKNEYNSTITKLMLSSNHGYKERHDTTTDGKPLQPAIVNFNDVIKPGEEGNPEDDSG